MVALTAVAMASACFEVPPEHSGGVTSGDATGGTGEGGSTTTSTGVSSGAVGTGSESGPRTTSTDGGTTSSDGGHGSTGSAGSSASSGGETSGSTGPAGRCTVGDPACSCSADGCMEGTCNQATDSCVDEVGGMLRIPASVFAMGCDPTDPCAVLETDPAALASEGPRHDVDVPEFWLDRFEVTVGEYRGCADAGVCNEPAGLTSQWSGRPSRYSPTPGPTDDHPADYVTRSQAIAFCAWLGKRLPSEAEFEKASRGSDARVFPWGADAPACLTNVIKGQADGPGCGTGGTLPVGTVPDGASPFGAEDLSGSVWEFVADDWHDTFVGAPEDGSAWRDGGDQAVIRGGGPSEREHRYFRATKRAAWNPDETSPNLGFRCARGSRP